jgi:hypothetical protein
MNAVIAELTAAQIGGELALDDGTAFELESAESAQRLRARLQSL